MVRAPHDHHDHGAECLCDRLPVEAVTSERDEAIDQARSGLSLSRRSIVAGVGLAAAGAALAPAAAASPAHRPPAAPGTRGLELVLLGTRAGPPVDLHQVGAATALVVDGQTYVVDCGRASVTQFVKAGLRLDSIRGIFLTHLHADHIADYYNFFMLGGHIKNQNGDHIERRVPVLGPGPAGGLQPKFGGGAAPTVNPSDPTPGTKQMTESLHAAYAYSMNVFLRDMNVVDIRTLMDVREIQLPGTVTADYLNTSPDMSPFEIYRDDKVTVTATLVPHGPVFPAYAFRFDTAYGSVTFSGDTRYSTNLVEMAEDTDILVHEAIGVEGAGLPDATLDHMLQSHVLIEKVGEVAQQAHAKHLVVSHYADLGAPKVDVRRWTRLAQRGYRGRTTVGWDLDRFTLGRRPGRR
ncbi:MBL fold metallo-hydrolase [Janibacter melonis]|uniref:MBL fold metallo-hydrolase n=1 Tax=Janibacter melonis TaxID=262209 RepID=UPI002042EA81|nr:MBL fold metallo-hydrolase [Janibacter melonis]MCM3555781.1 MBL fold metallo-hydrolase [Janibacter melonis]